MSDGPRIVHPFAPSAVPSSKELIANATRWAQVAQNELPKSLAHIFIFCPREAIGQGRGILVSSLRNNELRDELNAVLKRWGDQQRIIMP